jgi:hypothetical protein
MGKIIAELILLLIGAGMVLWPKVLVRFQVWSQRTLMGAEYIPSQRTYTAMRLTGVFLIFLSLLILLIA